MFNKFKLKKTVPFVLSLAFIAGTFSYTVAQNSESNIEVFGNTSVKNLGSGNFSLRTDETTGVYYLATEVFQGLDFEFLGEGNFSLWIDGNTGDVLLVNGDVSDLNLENLQPLVETPTIDSRRTLPAGTSQWISTICVNTGRFIEGAWSGGIDGLVVFSRVAAVTNNSQAQSIVRTGLGTPGTSSYGRWAPNGSRSDVSRSTGAFGNVAGWDLQGR
ncbi:MAG: hypothetical protein FWF57_00845 [Defluviitaleaceae bacterium]|nr:hypothetical protein [Defluviitaleaceae bacterium]